MTWIHLPAEYRNLRTPPAAQKQDTPRWYEFRNASEDDAELLIFSEIGGWFGVWADEFVEELNQVSATRLTLRLNSPGGSVWHGVAIANALRAHPASVTVRVEGLAASIASIIALAGDTLVMAPNSMMMIHDASTYTWGDSAELRKTADVLDKISDNLADAYAAKAGGSRAEWRGRMLAETWYTAAEAVEAGLADELMVPPKTDDPEEPEGPDDAVKLMAACWDLSVFRYAGRAAAPAPIPAPADAAPQTGTLADTGRAGAHDGRLPYPLSTTAAPQDQAPAATPSRSPDATPHTPHAEPVPQPASARAEPALPETPGTSPAAEPVAGPVVDPWADLVAHLLTPADPSAEDLLAHLREAM
ncbi:head maturation protease, ClpP-related [Nonomuraea sp. GTA35]|uniref:head maturation protease, ClpP-related n=1 Tax=Nonomuraea sp. GTA35 TaxID=1676746 RepID=UPI0035C1D870